MKLGIMSVNSLSARGKSLSILFYKNGDPMDSRCIGKFLSAFPRGYWRVVREIIARADKLDKDTFRFNVARLLPSFKMTRAGVFQSLRIRETGVFEGPVHVVDLCWESVGDELQLLKKSVQENVMDTRSRVLVELSRKSEEHIITTTSRIFDRLTNITVKNENETDGKVGPVAASKILFAVLPEIALPVDTSEWKHVFMTKDYGKVLSSMVMEIKEWEKMSSKKLDKVDENPMTTLPTVFNVLAMAARPL